MLIQNAAISNTSKREGQSVEEHARTARPSNVALDEMRAVWETNVCGVLAVRQAMLLMLRATPGARIVSVSSGVASLTRNANPGFADRRIFGPVYPASKTALNALTPAVAIELEPERGQGQRGLSRFHEDQSERMRGDGDGRRGCTQGGACGSARPGWPDRRIDGQGRPDHCLVIGSAQNCARARGRKPPAHSPHSPGPIPA